MDSNIFEVVKSDGLIEILIVDKFVIVIGFRLYCFDDVDFSYW